MSILSDLDPKNSRLRVDNTRTKPSWPRWLLALPLFMGGGLYLAGIGTGKVDTSAPPPVAAPVEQSIHSVADSARNTALNSLAEPSTPGSGSATIRVSTAGNLPNPASPPLSQISETAETSGTSRPPLSKIQAMQESRLEKPTGQATPAKRTQKNSTAVASKAKKNARVSTNQRAQSSGGKEQERDVDIISAMVR